MMPAVLPAQEGVVCAVARLTCRLQAPAGGRGPAARRLISSWRSLLGGAPSSKKNHIVAAATSAPLPALTRPRRAPAGRRPPAAQSAGGGGGGLVRAAASAAGPSSASAAPPAGGPRVCILGGGFGGLYTAVKLEALMWPPGTRPQVTLIDQAERFTFKPLLYELLSGAAGEDEVAPPFAQLLAPYAVTFVRGRVAAVRPDGAPAAGGGGSEGGGAVVLESGDSVPYDWLVLALGAETNTFGVPGVKENALGFSTYADAARVAARLDALDAAPSPPSVVVVGGGYAGVELAAAVAERRRGRGRVQLVTSGGDVLPAATQGQREAARRALADGGVAILAGEAVTEVRAVAPGGEGAPRLVYTRGAGGEAQALEADLVLWAAGQAPAPRADAAAAAALPFPADARGATETDATLRVLRHPRVFALGDVAVGGGGGGGGGGGAGGAPLPATAQVAFQQADYVAWNLWASMNGRPLLRFAYQHLGDMMSLGASRGAVALPIPVPPPLSAAAGAGPLGELLRAAGVRVSATYAGGSDGVTLEGPLAAGLRRAAYLYRQPTDEQRLKVAAAWAGEATRQVAELARQVLGGGRPGGRP
jgi:NADH dehydrogenase FAD-containing subunit